MSPSRRDILKLAAGLGLTGAIPTSAERIAAAEVLNQRVSDNPVLDPGLFTEEVNLRLAMALPDWMASICPEEAAAERKALEVLESVNPAFTTGDPGRALWGYQAAIFAYALALYDAGLRHGAAFENMRRAVVGEHKLCDACWGTEVAEAGEDCPECGGTALARHSA